MDGHHGVPHTIIAGGRRPAGPSRSARFRRADRVNAFYSTQLS